VRKSESVAYPVSFLEPQLQSSSRCELTSAADIFASPPTLYVQIVGGHDAPLRLESVRESELLKASQGVQPHEGSVWRFTICTGTSRRSGSFEAGFFLGFLVSRCLASLFPMATC
jgi:hypothetical protein